MLHVADLPRSIAFYKLLGFELIDIEGAAASPYWARMHCEGAAIMLLLAEEPLDEAVKRIPFYMYAPDLPAFREHLLANGIEVSGINRPPYMKSGEVRVQDPDGYVIFVGHWGDAEHSDWLRRIEEKKKAGALPA